MMQIISNTNHMLNVTSDHPGLPAGIVNLKTDVQIGYSNILLPLRECSSDRAFPCRNILKSNSSIASRVLGSRGLLFVTLANKRQRRITAYPFSF